MVGATTSVLEFTSLPLSILLVMRSVGDLINTGLYGTMIIRIGRGEAETNTDNQSPIESRIRSPTDRVTNLSPRRFPISSSLYSFNAL